MKNNCQILYAFANGTVVPLRKVNDPVFSSHTLGKGVAIEPVENTLYAPCDAKVSIIADTNHAISLVAESGAEILLHIGIDTVNLNGKFFEPRVAVGKSVKKGDKLIEFQRDKIIYEGYDATICMAICNTPDYKEFEITDKEDVTGDDILMTIYK